MTCGAACGIGPVVPGDPIARTDLAEAWRREDEAVGADDTARRRFETLLVTLPYVLELGCGAGHFLALAAARGHRAIGFDFSEPAVARAQARGLNAFCGGVEDLPRIVGSTERFDALAMFHLIEHLTDPAAFLRAVGTWLRPEARIFVSCPGPRRFTRLIHQQQIGGSDFWDYPPQHVARWTLPALRALLERAGWRVTTAVEEPFSWTAAASQIGVARAVYRRRLHRPLARRALIAGAWLRLVLAPRRRCGVSLYTKAVREASGA